MNPEDNIGAEGNASPPEKPGFQDKKDSNKPNFTAHEWTNNIIQLLAPLGIVAAIVFILRYEPAKAGTQAVATITFITGAAVGIERVIEGFWNLLGSRIGVYWPMTSISRQVHGLETELMEAVVPFQDKLKAALQKAAGDDETLQARLTTGAADISKMQQRLGEIRAHAPSNQRMQLLAASASQSVNFLATKYQEYLPELRNGVALADTAIGGMQDFLATFKDNPGRRLLSLYLGMLLGLLLAGLFGLDVFAATGGATDGLPATAGLRIVATGLLIGLGSNPTHEVIQALQEYKKGRKGENTSKPKLPSKLLGINQAARPQAAPVL